MQPEYRIEGRGRGVGHEAAVAANPRMDAVVRKAFQAAVRSASGVETGLGTAETGWCAGHSRRKFLKRQRMQRDGGVVEIEVAVADARAPGPERVLLAANHTVEEIGRHQARLGIGRKALAVIPVRERPI